ncbi:MAG: hypothetical protein LLF28_08395 [Nitrospiraceae bacterium]|nr:hypothetical protein [Nitrospiraceae bacterium]
MNEDKIKLTSKFVKELTSKVSIEGKEYLVQTENSGAKRPLVVTRIYLQGKVLSTSQISSDIDNEEQLHEFMNEKHHLTIEALKKEKTKKLDLRMSSEEYVTSVKTLLAKKNHKSALELLNEGLLVYPDDPFLLSYYGCFVAVVNKNFKLGIEICKRAIQELDIRMPFGQEFFYPFFYLNLGRVYIAAGRKQNAADIFRKGLKIDASNYDIIAELKKLGIRGKLPVPFLKRSNPLNKYLGMFIHKTTKLYVARLF